MMEKPLSGAVRTDGAALAAYLQSLPSVKSHAPGPFGEGETPDAPHLTVVMSE